MIVLSDRLQNALQEEIKVPLNAYSKMRQAKLNEYAKKGITENVVIRFKAFWANMPEIEKQDLEEQYRKEIKKGCKDYIQWIGKHGISDEDIKEIRAFKQQNREAAKPSKKSKSKKNRSTKATARRARRKGLVAARAEARAKGGTEARATRRTRTRTSRPGPTRTRVNPRARASRNDNRGLFKKSRTRYQIRK